MEPNEGIFGWGHDKDERKIETELENLEREVETVERIEEKILHKLDPRLTSIKIAFTKCGEESMSKQKASAPVVGPVTLNQVGAVATATVLGFDQNGNPWTGTLPVAAYTDDDSAGAIATLKDNGDGTATITDVANGVVNLTATLVTAEGVTLTDIEQVNVANPPPAPPVLSSIKIAFSV